MNETNEKQQGRTLAHLLTQLQHKMHFSQEHVAAALGIPRSTFARNVSTAQTVPEEWWGRAYRWIAESLGVSASQVEQLAAGNSAGIPVTLLDLRFGAYIAIEEDATKIATSLTRHWSGANVTMLCPSIPPLFLLTKRIINRIDRNQCSNHFTEEEREWSHRMHRRIARHIWLSPDALPARWELIIPERLIVSMQRADGLFAGTPIDSMTELDEIWLHDFVVDRRLVIRALPDTEVTQPIIRHFSDAQLVIFVNDRFRWKEMGARAQVHVTSSGSSLGDDPLRWDRQIIEMARAMSVDYFPGGEGTSLLGFLRNYKQEAIQIKTESLKLVA